MKRKIGLAQALLSDPAKRFSGYSKVGSYLMERKSLNHFGMKLDKTFISL
ncbi:hypothetical protein ACFP3I_11120 [Chryseobacterium arachidis]